MATGTLAPAEEAQLSERIQEREHLCRGVFNYTVGE